MRPSYNYESRIVQSSSNSQSWAPNPPMQFEGHKKSLVNNHTNLLIQQNEMYGAADSAGDLQQQHSNTGDERYQTVLQKGGNKYQTATNLSKSAVTSSSRRLHMKNI